MSSRADRHDAEHALAMAALQAGDLAGPELERAARLHASCPACATLHADLGTLRSAVRTAPVTPRRRDFRLTPEDAARLRPSGWRRLVAWLGAPQSSVRPLATGLATIGLAGLLLTSVPGLARFGSTTVLTNVGGATAPAEQSTLDRVGVEAAPGATEGPRAGTYGASSGAPVPSNAPAVPGAENPAVPGAENPAAQPSPAGAVAGAGDEGPATDDAAAGDPGRNAGETPLPDQPQPVPLVVVASIALLASGLALFAARWAVRRPRA